MSDHRTLSNGSRWLAGLGLFIVIFMSVSIAFYAIAFQARLVGDPSFHLRFDASPLFPSLHVIGGAVVLMLGGLQFWGALRRNYTKVHRWMGRIYLSFVLIGGIGGLVLAPQSNGGVVAHFGFGMLAVLWMFSGWQAYRSIRQGDVEAHRGWMLRNFAMTFGAVMLRIYLGLFAAAGVEFAEAYQTVAWIAWVPNLILVEWYLVLMSQGKSRGRKPQNA
ncbi:MAG: DUF2306 domain-containing protein [SAR86 cluster bacterium]|jgi:uncharacterized membrane protein|uniref:DUF2306 domain-containing protein n=1 Tax=SAR86 cluster bacterium TaxID=2030880 RepID=A0A973ABJ9_9GAMM|nr:DUF2306 domain-containing protein [SAR86 cluster bacterium]